MKAPYVHASTLIIVIMVSAFHLIFWNSAVAGRPCPINKTITGSENSIFPSYGSPDGDGTSGKYTFTVQQNDIMHGYDQKQNHSSTRGIIWTSSLATLGFLILAGVSLWSWSLKKQIHKNTRQLSQELAEKKRIETSLNESEKRFRSLFENTPVPVWEEDFSKVKTYIDSLKDEHGGNIGAYLKDHPHVLSRCIELVRIIDVNRAALVLHDVSDKKDLLKSLEKIFTPESHEAFRKALDAILTGHTDMEIDTVVQTVLGDKREIAFNMSVPPGYEKTLSRVLVSTKDITQRKRIEAQLRQAQKMEAIGTLAGGIAHDFNNILSAIIGYTEITVDNFPTESKTYKNLQGVLKAAERARNLVKQILTLTRQAEGERKPIQVSLIIKEALKLLRSSIPSTISIVEHIDKDSGLITADPSQIHQVIMNLCTHAYQAMEEHGGTMAVTLENAMIEADAMPAAHIRIHPGMYLKLVVSDTGPGMDQATIDHIFDPYFTSQEYAGKTGLGLPTIKAIVTGLDGIIQVDSTPDKGTTFTVYLPCIQMDTMIEPAMKATAIQGKNEHILLIDDESSLVQIEKEMLENLAYRVTTKTDSTEALRLFLEHPQGFDLIITDMTMPSLTGVALSRKILQIRRDIPIILCTGFSDKVDREEARRIGIQGYLDKPFKKNDLALTVRRVLDEAGDITSG